MAIPQTNLVRKQFLISQETVKKIKRLAEAGHISESEVVRQAIESYNPEQSRELEIPELMNFVSTRLKETIDATKKANKKLINTLKLLAQGDN